MPCPLCSHDKTYKHGKTSKGNQRYRCLNCKQTFTSTFDTIYQGRQVTFEEVRVVLQSHCEGTSLRGISRIRRIRAASQKAQLIHSTWMNQAWTNAMIMATADVNEERDLRHSGLGIESAGYRLLYLPAYSPNLNRIERCWAWFKSRIRKCLSSFDSLRQAMEFVLKDAVS